MPNSTTVTFSDPNETIGSDVKKNVVVTARGEYRGSLTLVELHRLLVPSGWHSLSIVHHLSVREGRCAISFSTKAHPPATCNGVEVLPGEMVITGPGGEYHGAAPAQTHWGSLSMTTGDFAAFSQALVGRDLKPPPETRVIRPEPAATSRLLSLHNAVESLATNTPDILAHPEVAKAIEQELVRAWIACLTGTSRERPQPLRRTVMQRFEHFIEAHRDEPLYVNEVCATIGITDRTLRLHCQAYLGMSPHRYLWLRRMHQVRRALTLADPAKTSVTTIAHDHGFAELGRFAVAYRGIFGEVPSMTLRRST